MGGRHRIAQYTPLPGSCLGTILPGMTDDTVLTNGSFVHNPTVVVGTYARGLRLPTLTHLLVPCLDLYLLPIPLPDRFGLPEP